MSFFFNDTATTEIYTLSLHDRSSDRAGRRHPLLAGVEEGDCVYFVHSFYAAECDDVVIATAEYGAQLTAAVARGNVMGCQFHPEKSGTVGLTILKTFCEWEW